MIVCGAPSSAHAADPKKGGAKKKVGENLNDNFDKQMQWENNVMGPDDKRAELAKIARASAIAKAAAEKAASEKAVADKNAAKEEARRTPATKSAAPVLLATPEDENAGKSTKSRDDKGSHEISPKLSTEEAMTPPPPVKPADDKFIDKLLKGEPGKKKVVRNDDELNDLLAKDKIAPAPKPRGKRVDSVDDLLRSAEKQPDMPATKARTPDWAKVETAPAAAPPPVMPRPQPKKDDGVIHIVQGAAGTSSSPRPQVAAATPSRRTQNTDTYDRSEADPFDAPRTRRGAGRSASFADPFADSSPAPRARVVAPPPPRPVAPPPPRAPTMTRREAAAPPPGWRDPFSDGPSDRKPAKRAAETKAPAGHPPGWKDPFSDAAPVHTHRTVVALGDSTASKHAAASGTTGNWALLKKQPRR